MLVVRISIRFYEELTEANTVNAANFRLLFRLYFGFSKTKQKEQTNKKPNKKQNINMNDRFFLSFSVNSFMHQDLCIALRTISFI